MKQKRKPPLHTKKEKPLDLDLSLKKQTEQAIKDFTWIRKRLEKEAKVRQKDARRFQGVIAELKRRGII